MIKKYLFTLVDSSHASEKKNRIFSLGMMILISLNVLAVIFETEDSLYQQFKNAFDLFDIISIAIFTVEYLIRIWVCIEDARFKSPIVGRLRYALQPMSLIDLFSFLPFYLPFISIDLRFIRAVRLFRIFRVLKFGRYSSSLARLGNVIKAKKEELGITMFSGFIILVISSSVMYFLEREAQPEAFSSIPASMWWAVATLTTVGYGDIYPRTIFGKIIGSFIAVIGIGLFALPAGIIASGFITELQKKPEKAVLCPHCGKKINSTSDNAE